MYCTNYMTRSHIMHEGTLTDSYFSHCDYPVAITMVSH